MTATALRAIACSGVLGALLVFSGPLLAQELQPIPPLQARVTDLTGTLTANQQTALEEKLTAFEQRKGAQVAVLLVPTTRPETIEQYSIRVADSWKLGREETDDGALLLIAKEDRRIRIEVGDGLEGALTDVTSKRIIEETITPLFRQGDFYGGIDAGLDQMIRVIDGEPLPEPDRTWQRDEPVGGPGIGNILIFLFVVVPIVAGLLRAMLGRPLGALATGGAVGGLVWLLSKLLAIAIGAGVLAFLFALLTGTHRSGWASRPRYGGFPMGVPGGFGGRGGFGGGGFRGGGGRFSGGGASGGW